MGAVNHSPRLWIQTGHVSRAICFLVAAVILLDVVALFCFPGHSLLGQLRTGSSLAADLERLHSSTVFQLLQATQHRLERSEDSKIIHPEQLQHQPHCQVKDKDMQGVLTAVAASTAAYAAAGSSLSKQQARAAALQLRAVLWREWTAVLQPFAQPAQSRRPTHSQQDSSSCKSVGLVPASEQASTVAGESITALLLVLGDWASLERMLRLYAINLYTIWSYARLHGYGLELYVHGEPLPHAMPVFFIKVLGVRHLFDMGYQHVLYLDMDTFTSPHSAPSLSLFYGQFPASSFLLQAEDNLCAATLLWRNTPDAQLLLQAWWDVGAAGCCPTFPHDQTALKHMLTAYAANITGHAWVYAPHMQRRFKLPAHSAPMQAEGASTAADAPAENAGSSAVPNTSSSAAAAPAAAAAAAQLSRVRVLSTDYANNKVSTWVKLGARLRERHSALGFVGLDVFDKSSALGKYSRIVLHNCLGMWWGCVPFETPALLYHTGHWAMDDLSETWLAERLLHSVWDWTSTLQL